MQLLLERLASVLLTLLGVSVLAFALLALASGDAVTAMLGSEADPAAIATLRASYALDAPLPLRFAAWFGHAVTGDLGRSIQTGRPVLAMVVAALGPTVELTGVAFVVSLLIAIPAGVLAAARHGRAADVAASLLAVCGLSLPAFWLALLLIAGLSIRLPWLPSSGHVGFATAPWEAFRHLVLPTLTLAAALSAATLRMTRSAMLEVLPADFVRTARAKGLSPLRVLSLHALRPALAPVVPLLAVQLGQLLGGVVITETMFAWPGIGKLVVDAIFARDYPVVQGVLLVTATLFLAVNLLADVAAVALDPRQQRVA
jgi:peptide/nickel transport system permease protein